MQKISRKHIEWFSKSRRNIRKQAPKYSKMTPSRWRHDGDMETNLHDKIMDRYRKK